MNVCYSIILLWMKQINNSLSQLVVYILHLNRKWLRTMLKEFEGVCKKYPN